MKLLEKYQHLFALNLKELGKTSLVQHEIRLSNNTPFKGEVPPHQYEEVRKHLQVTQAFANPTDLASSRCMGKCFPCRDTW